MHIGITVMSQCIMCNFKINPNKIDCSASNDVDIYRYGCVNILETLLCYFSIN